MKLPKLKDEYKFPEHLAEMQFLLSRSGVEPETLYFLRSF